MQPDGNQERAHVPGALFIDFENVFYAIVNGPLMLSGDAALAATMDVLAGLRRQLRGDGVALVVERCYADWEQMPSTAQRQLAISGIAPRFVDGRVGKSSADIELALDLLEVALRRPEIRHITLVGGDRDYLPILRRLKEHQRTLQICSLRHALSGDVREFASNYAHASVRELDPWLPLLVEEAREASSSAGGAGGVVLVVGESRAIPAPDLPTLYLGAMLRFLNERKYNEIHLGPFFRWLQAERVFELVSVREQRKAFEELQRLEAVQVEERESGSGYPFSVAMVDWNHPLVHAANR